MQKTSNIYLFGFLAIILAISGPWFDVSVSNHSFVKAYVGGIGIALFVLFTLYQKYKTKVISDVIYHISYIKLFFGLTFLLGLFSIFWSVNPDFSITQMLIWVTIFMSFYSAYNFDITEANLAKLSFYLILAGASIAIIGIIQYLSSTNPFSITQAANPSSTFGNKNMATQPISMIFPLVTYLMLRKTTPVKVMWIVAIAGALMITFNFYTSTRASWVAITGEVFLMTTLLIVKRKSFNQFASWNKQKAIIVLSAFLLMLILINFNQDGFLPFWDKASNNFNRLTSSIQDDKSLRYQIWSVAITIIKDSPFFGTGAGTWFHDIVQGGYSTHNITYVQRVHNDILEMAVSLGLIGVSIFFMGIVAVLYALWAIISKANNRYLLFYFALFESLSGSFVNMQFSFPYQLAMPALLFGLYLGLIAKKSEEFIKPLKEYIIKKKSLFAKVHKKIIITINLIIFIVITSIYSSWITMYSNLNKINIVRDYNKLSKIVETPIYHLEIQNIMNFLVHAYMNNDNGSDIAEKIIKQQLKYWPNDFITKSRYIHLLYKTKRYNQALELIKENSKTRRAGFYNDFFVELSIYIETKEYQKYVNRYIEISKINEKDLTLRFANVKNMLAYSLKFKQLYKFAPKFYKIYKNNFKYDCGMESNMLAYYHYIGDNKGLRDFYTKEIENKNNCLNASLVLATKNKLHLK